jgi:hypothetical protein
MPPTKFNPSRRGIERAYGRFYLSHFHHSQSPGHQKRQIGKFGYAQIVGYQKTLLAGRRICHPPAGPGHHQQRQPRPKRSIHASAKLLLASAQQDPCRYRQQQTTAQKDQPDLKRRHQHRSRQIDPALAEENGQVKGLEGITNRGKEQNNAKINKEKLQQQWRAAEKIYVPTRYVAYQPVSRQAGNASEGAKQRGKNDAKEGDLEGVQRPDQQRPRIRVAGVIINHAFADVELGVYLQKEEATAKTVCTVGAAEGAKGADVLADIAQQPARPKHHQYDEDNLGNDSQKTAVAPQRYLFCCRWKGGGLLGHSHIPVGCWGMKTQSDRSAGLCLLTNKPRRFRQPSGQTINGTAASTTARLRSKQCSGHGAGRRVCLAPGCGCRFPHSCPPA